MSAANYTVNFGYKAQDGYYYGPNGIVGKYHRGNDRPTPTGTPIIISGVTIGLTGATGLVSGPHLHTQACTAGSNYANDLDPSPYEFKNGTVVNAGWHSQFGNHIVIRVGGVDITYAHLSRINVSVGQVIGAQGGNTVFENDQQIQDMYFLLRGRNATGEEVAGWRGKPIIQFAQNQYAKQEVSNREAYRQQLENRVREVEQALLNEQSKPPKEVVKEIIKVVKEPVEVPVEVPIYVNDEETRENTRKILSMVTSIFDYFRGQYKSFAKYIKKG